MLISDCTAQILRERRIAEKHMRMRQKLAEKQARDEAESSEKAAKVELREKYKSKIETWQAGKRVSSSLCLSFDTRTTMIWVCIVESFEGGRWAHGL